MSKRERVQIGNYFTSEKTELGFVSSGCTLLDCALGGGYVLGRITNLVGDRSTAKTALATEALINFIQQYPDGKPAYRETEAAFDKGYAEAMGLPLARIDFGDEENPLATVEDFAADFEAFLDAQIKAKSPGIYVLDSLDALSDEAEMDSSLDKGTYGMAKAKLLSIFFRKTARKIEKSKVLLLVVSQVRDNINAMFGDKHRRSGGKALDFYASQIVWLSHLKTLKKTINKVERSYGITVKAKLKKNKVGLPFREAEFDFLFGFGVEDLGASIEWLNEIGRIDQIEWVNGNIKDYLKRIDSMTAEEYNSERRKIASVVRCVWAEVENTFLPKRKKY